jgi:putative flippase GtrA
MRALRALYEIRLVREAAGYIAAASVAFVFDFSLYALLIALGVPYLLAAGTSFILGTAIHYWGATRYVFSFRRLSGTRSEFWIFLLVGAFGLLLNLAAIYFCVEVLKLHVLVAKIVATAMTFVANFGLRRLLLFTPWRPAVPRAETDTYAPK